MTTPSFSGAIDLSGLSASTTVTTRTPPPPPVQDIPEGAFACTVEDGCRLVVMGPHPHEVVSDCLETVIPYVERYLETREASIEVAEEYHRAVAAYKHVLAANQRLAEENDSLKAQLREARKGTPAAEKHVLAGAADLAASMKASFGPKEPEVRTMTITPDALTTLANTETCDCCGQERLSLPFHHDAHDDSGESWDYCQRCYDAGCSVNDPTGGCVL